MTLKIEHAKLVQQRCGARQVVVVAFDADGRCSVVSYGATRAECSAVAELCDAIADGLEDGTLPAPRRTRRVEVDGAATRSNPLCALCGADADGDAEELVDLAGHNPKVRWHTACAEDDPLYAVLLRLFDRAAAPARVRAAFAAIDARGPGRLLADPAWWTDVNP